MSYLWRILVAVALFCVADAACYYKMADWSPKYLEWREKDAQRAAWFKNFESTYSQRLFEEVLVQKRTPDVLEYRWNGLALMSDKLLFTLQTARASGVAIDQPLLDEVENFRKEFNDNQVQIWTQWRGPEGNRKVYFIGAAAVLENKERFLRLMSGDETAVMAGLPELPKEFVGVPDTFEGSRFAPFDRDGKDLFVIGTLILVVIIGGSLVISLIVVSERADAKKLSEIKLTSPQPVAVPVVPESVPYRDLLTRLTALEQKLASDSASPEVKAKITKLIADLKIKMKGAINDVASETLIVREFEQIEAEFQAYKEISS